MLSETDMQEYLDEVREKVCSRCVERPPGGPPCLPWGKVCGVELHLPQLITSVQQVHSDSIVPYLDHNRAQVCSKCIALGDCDCCPCPMESLSVLVVQAIEAVEERRKLRERLTELWSD